MKNTQIFVACSLNLFKSSGQVILCKTAIKSAECFAKIVCNNLHATLHANHYNFELYSNKRLLKKKINQRIIPRRATGNAAV